MGLNGVDVFVALQVASVIHDALLKGPEDSQQHSALVSPEPHLEEWKGPSVQAVGVDVV